MDAYQAHGYEKEGGPLHPDGEVSTMARDNQRVNVDLKRKPIDKKGLYHSVWIDNL
jgi:hypothetical protein